MLYLYIYIYIFNHFSHLLSSNRCTYTGMVQYNIQFYHETQTQWLSKCPPCCLPGYQFERSGPPSSSNAASPSPAGPALLRLSNTSAPTSPCKTYSNSVIFCKFTHCFTTGLFTCLQNVNICLFFSLQIVPVRRQQWRQRNKWHWTWMWFYTGKKKVFAHLSKQSTINSTFDNIGCCFYYSWIAYKLCI